MVGHTPGSILFLMGRSREYGTLLLERGDAFGELDLRGIDLRETSFKIERKSGCMLMRFLGIRVSGTPRVL